MKRLVEGARVVATRKIGQIRDGAEGKVLRSHVWDTRSPEQVTVRFDEYPHDYIIDEKDLKLKKREQPPQLRRAVKQAC